MRRWWEGWVGRCQWGGVGEASDEGEGLTDLSGICRYEIMERFMRNGCPHLIFNESCSQGYINRVFLPFKEISEGDKTTLLVECRPTSCSHVRVVCGFL